MKYFLSPIIFICVILGSACGGTEVGNGIVGDKEEEKDNTSKAPNESAPDVESDAPGKDVALPPKLPPQLFVACASPFSEKISGSFIDSKNTQAFTVETGEDNVRTIKLTQSTVSYKVTPAPSLEQPFAITALAESPDLSCGAVTTTTLEDGTLQRTLTLSDTTVLTWTVANNEVKSIATGVGASAKAWTKASE